MFDSSHGRTCLHYAAYYGHADCLRTILSAAKSAPVSESWLAFVAPSRRRSYGGLFANLCSAVLWRCRGFARFVNVRDDTGATPLHLAARQGWRRCVHVLLENGAIVSASSGAFGSGFLLTPLMLSNDVFLCQKNRTF